MRYAPAGGGPYTLNIALRPARTGTAGQGWARAGAAQFRSNPYGENIVAAAPGCSGQLQRPLSPLHCQVSSNHHHRIPQVVNNTDTRLVPILGLVTRIPGYNLVHSALRYPALCCVVRSVTISLYLHPWEDRMMPLWHVQF